MPHGRGKGENQASFDAVLAGSTSIFGATSYLEHSLEAGTQSALSEPNGEALCARVRTAVSDFLFNEWRSGALLGSKSEEAYTVRCDRSTMTQNDIDAGRLICVVGVAPVKPAEFVIFRISQWTADRPCE